MAKHIREFVNKPEPQGYMVFNFSVKSSRTVHATKEEALAEAHEIIKTLSDVEDQHVVVMAISAIVSRRATNVSPITETHMPFLTESTTYCGGARAFEDREVKTQPNEKVQGISYESHATDAGVMLQGYGFHPFVVPKNIKEFDLSDEISTNPSIPKGFIPWHGGECPVADGVEGLVILSNGEKRYEDLCAFYWENDIPLKIIAYRPIRPEGFKIEAGKYYITESGERVGPIVRGSYGLFFNEEKWGTWYETGDI